MKHRQGIKEKGTSETDNQEERVKMGRRTQNLAVYGLIKTGRSPELDENYIYRNGNGKKKYIKCILDLAESD